MPEQTLLEVEQQEAFHRQVHEYVQRSANPELALSILFKMQFDTPGWVSNTGLAEGLGVEQQAVDALLPYLAEVGLVRKLEEQSSSDPRFKDWKWDVWRAKEVEGYLRSDLPYGPHTLVERAGLTDAQLERAMSAVVDLATFSYNKRIALDIDRLRELRERSHAALEPIRAVEREFLHSALGINQHWTGFLPSFVAAADPTKSEGYDVRNFEFWGQFPTPGEAIKEGFSGAIGDPIIEDGEGEVWRVFFVQANRNESDGGRISLTNSRYGAAGNRNMKYQLAMKELLPKAQARLEAALG